jgi:hypothetical protein
MTYNIYSTIIYYMSTIDYNVDNYTISELFAILGLEFDFDITADQLTQSNINDINSGCFWFSWK